MLRTISLWIIVCNQAVVVEQDPHFLWLTMDYSRRMCSIIHLRLWEQTHLLEFAQVESHSLVKIKLHNLGVFLSPCTKQTPWSCILKNNNVIGAVGSH